MKKSPAFMPKALLAALSIGAISSCATSVSGNRAVAADGRAIHRAEQLDEFVLEKPVSFYGLGTKAALEKLDREYRETCRKAGEVPLDLAYEVPVGYDQPLNFQASGHFDDAVREIAATSRLEWKRSGTTYCFQAPQAPRESNQLTQETHSVPPDFLSRVSSGTYDPREGARGAFEKRGVSLDRSTRLVMKGIRLSVETRSPSDQAAISDMVKAVERGAPLQIRLDAQTFEIPSGQSWKVPANGIATRGDLAALRQLPGVHENALPAVCSRSYESGRISLPGETLRFQPGLLGLGVQVKAELSHKAHGTKSGTVSMDGQTPDGGTRIAITTRADGSRVVLAVTPTIIDATGRPVKQSR
jgi:hypothetical protein